MNEPNNAAGEVTLNCKRCEAPFTAPIFECGGGKQQVIAAFCDPCIAFLTAPTKPNLKQIDKVAIARGRFEKIVPSYYRSDAIVAKMPADKSAEMINRVKLAWTTGDPEKEGAAIISQLGGVLAVGPTGRFKTTTMFNGPVKWLIWKGQTVIWRRCSRWRQELSEAAQAGKLTAYLDGFIRARWLFLDDLGQMAGTPTAEESLKELLEARYHFDSGPLPLLITTQYNEDQFVARFKDVELGRACARRVFELAGTPIVFS